MTRNVFTFPPTVDAPAQARRAIAGLAFSEPPAMDLSLAVTELVTNSIRHADLPDDAHVEVRVLRAESTVRVEVCDPGQEFVITPRAPDEAGGRGLLIIDTIAERWGIERDGQTCVWFEMPLAQATG